MTRLAHSIGTALLSAVLTEALRRWTVARERKAAQERWCADWNRAMIMPLGPPSDPADPPSTMKP